MSIATEITRIQQAKADIKTAIEAKGVTVPSSATIDTYDDYVSQISGGGGASYETELRGIIDRTISGSLTIPSGVTFIGDYAFYMCTSLTSIDIPDSVTSIGIYAFGGCGLTSCTIGSGVTSIERNTFRNCTSLTSITVNATTPPTLANVNAFSSTNNCPIYVPSGSVETYKASNNWSSYADRIQAIPNS